MSLLEWTLFAPAAPTAAQVQVAGRVLNFKNYGVASAVISLIDREGNAKTVRSNQFGYFRFESVEAGGAYTVMVDHKAYKFAPQALSVNDDLTDLIIIGSRPNRTVH